MADQQPEVGEQQGEEEALTNAAGQNRQSVRCCRCESVVLQAAVAQLCTTRHFDLPPMTANADAAAANVGRWWTVQDMFAFENVGYSHAVNGVKYLTCADCEIGPIGFVDPDSKMNYVAVDRVRHC